MSDNVDNLVLEHLRALRGGQDRIEGELREIGARLTSLEAVPYTHLDVYKRQAHSPSPSAMTSLARGSYLCQWRR